MMGPLRLLISDVDGTLLRSDKSLGPPVITAVRRLMASGVEVTLISARPPSGMLWLANELGLSHAMAAFNGGTLVGQDGAILAVSRLPLQVATRAWDSLERPAIVRWLFSAGRWYTQSADGHHADRERVTTRQEPCVRSDFSDLLAEANKIVAVSDDPSALDDLESELTQTLGKEATVMRSQSYYLDITALDANKGHGVMALAARANIDLANVAVIGDQCNDLPMFAKAGLSIAMGQAPGAVRAAADCVTLSNDEDGLASAIYDVLFPLIEPPRRTRGPA